MITLKLFDYQTGATLRLFPAGLDPTVDLSSFTSYA